jgi:hypothetical protein
VYDGVIDRHVVSPYGFFLSGPSSAVGEGDNFKRVYLVGKGSKDLSAAIMNAKLDPDAAAVKPIIDTDISLSDLVVPRGLI